MKRTLRLLILIIALLSLGLVGCGLPGFSNDETEPESRPSVAISSPSGDEPVAPNEEVQVRSVAIDEQDGVVRVELLVNGEVIWVDANAQPEPNTPFIVAQPWTPAETGRFILQVKAYNATNAAGESETVIVEVAEPAANRTPQPTGTEAAMSVEGAIDEATRTPTRVQPPVATATPDDSGPSSGVTATPSVTLSPTPTPAPQEFDPTGLEPEGRFKDIWLEVGAGDSRLGYPVAPEITNRDYARQRFGKGLMFWWDNPEEPDYIWVIDSPAPDLKSGATSNLYPDTWSESDGTISCDAARERGPVRGFGKVWCQHPELQTRLGYPMEPERGSGGVAPFAAVQFFQGGVMFYTPNFDAVFVLFEQGDWQRFPY